MKLKRSFYGLTEAAKIGIKVLLETLKQVGFEETETAPCLFVKKELS